MSFTLAIIGRPNVGKSTLYNRLTGTRHALVADTPGLTRDRRSGSAQLGDLHFTVLDTAGLELSKKGSMEYLMMGQTEAAIEEADALLLLLDGREGITALDKHFAPMLRKRNRTVLVAVNKCEGKTHPDVMAEATALNLGDPMAISGEQGQGLDELYLALKALAEKQGVDLTVEPDDAGRDAVFIALAGRPNVGKSTLFNALLKQERAIVSPIAGTTRDAVTVDWEYKGHAIKLVDTAGMRRKARVEETSEKLSVMDTRRVIQYANIVVLVVDATQALEKQDLQIAAHALEEGRGLVIAVNKWDLAEDPKAIEEHIRYRLDTSLAQAKGVPVVLMSAMNRKNITKVIDHALQSFKHWNQRVSTGKLNRWLDHATSKHIPPMSKGKRVKFRYITQVKTRPPSFAIFTSSNTDELPESYLRYLTTSLRTEFEFGGAPIRIFLRKSDNPFDK